MKTYYEYLELITKNIIRKRNAGQKSVKPETIAPEYVDPDEYREYENFSNAAYYLFEKGLIDIEPVRKYANKQYFIDDVRNGKQPMIRKLIIKEESIEQITRLYLAAKKQNA